MYKNIITGLLFLMLALSLPYRNAEAQPRRATAPKPEALSAAPEIAYTVSMSKPATHLLEVEMRLKLPEGQRSVDLKMPVWTPGSYLIREYSRHVEDFNASDAAGKPLPWQKTAKNTWRVSNEGSRD